MKRILVLLCLLASFCATGEIITVATITGTGAKVALSTNVKTRAAWIQIIADSGNSAKVFFGDSTVSATNGLPIAAGAGYNTPACSSCIYTPAATYIYISNGDKAYVAFGN